MTDAARLVVPAPDDGDCLPHDRAVWRSAKNVVAAPEEAIGRRISVDHGQARFRLHDCGSKADWPIVFRWRFGWPPMRDR